MPQQQSAATYDPLNPSPYQAPQLPPVQAPQPSPLPPPDQARDFGGTAPSKSGGIAFILDNAMRGVMQGRAIAQQSKALALDKATQSSQALYNMAAQNLQGLIESYNVPPDQVQALLKNPGQVPQGMDQSVYGQLHNAASVVNQAWGNIQKLYASQVQPPTKKGKKQDQQNPLQMIASQDPQEKLQGLYQLWSKMPPPIYGQLGQAAQNAQLRAKELDLANKQMTAQGVAADAQTAAITRDQRIAALEQKATRTPDEDQELAGLIRARDSVAPQGGTWDVVGTINGRTVERNSKDPRQVRYLGGDEVDPADLDKLVPKTTGAIKVPEPDIKSGTFYGVNMPDGTKVSVDDLKKGNAPPEAVAIYGEYLEGLRQKQQEDARKQQEILTREAAMFQYALNRQDYTDAKKTLGKTHDDVMAADSRLATMEQNAKDAYGPNGEVNQQAMVSILMNHIGMTLGAQKGTRISQAVIKEAEASAPWVQRAYATWGHDDPATGEWVYDGYKTGITLTGDQINQMVQLAREKDQILNNQYSDLMSQYADTLSLNRRNQSKAGLPPQAIQEIKNAGGRPVNFKNGQTWKWVNGAPQQVQK